MRIVIDYDALMALLTGAQIQIPESALESLYRERGAIIIHLSEDALSMAHAEMGSPEIGEMH
jgi:hypothetical protein